MCAMLGTFAPNDLHCFRLRYIGGMEHHKRKRLLRDRVAEAMRLGEGMTAREFAENAGVSYSTVRHLKSKTNSISDKVADKIEAYLQELGVSPTDEQQEKRRKQELESLLRNRLAPEFRSLARHCGDKAISPVIRAREIRRTIENVDRVLQDFRKLLD